MNCKIACMSLMTVLMFTLNSYAGTNTNTTASAKSPAAIKIEKIVFEGGDGSSMERAVLVKNAKGEEDGVASEYQWIRNVHPGWQTGNQALQTVNGKSYDRLECRTPKGETKTVYFDITELFGK